MRASAPITGRGSGSGRWSSARRSADNVYCSGSLNFVPSEARNSGEANIVRSTWAISPSVAVNVCAIALTRSTGGSSRTKNIASLRDTNRAVEGWRASRSSA